MKGSKLTPFDVRRIREMREKEKMLVPDIHKHFPHVSVWTIYKVIEYYSWPMVR